jgi:hypothetical protein
MFTVTGQVMKTYVQPGRTDNKTGEITEPSVKVQLLGMIPLLGGESKLEMVSLTIENRKIYDELQGKHIRVTIGMFSPAKGNIVLFIPKSSKPEQI